ncbi:MAG: GNAT family N-acetyltransferase [Rubrobacter sp.]|nr:GNAT family N-acetyltransferase [Rubrobacter sp.]
MFVFAMRGESSGVAPGFHIRRMTDGDLSRIMELRAAVKWPADPGAFDLLRGMRDARWAVAESPDGAMCGMVGAVPFPGGIGVLCHLAVRREYRNIGLGASLAAWAVAYLRSRGSSIIRLYTTPEAKGLYTATGFEPGEFRTVYRLENANERVIPKPDGYRIETLCFGDLPEMYGLDRWSYGADRSHLILSILRLHPGRGLAARDSSGRMKGYLVRSSSGGETRIGPFMAADASVARLLLSRAIEGGGTPLRLTVPGGSPAHEMLHEFGFEGKRDRLRMEMGRIPKPRGLDEYATTAYLAT